MPLLVLVRRAARTMVSPLVIGRVVSGLGPGRRRVVVVVRENERVRVGVA